MKTDTNNSIYLPTLLGDGNVQNINVSISFYVLIYNANSYLLIFKLVVHLLIQ